MLIDKFYKILSSIGFFLYFNYNKCYTLTLFLRSNMTPREFLHYLNGAIELGKIEQLFPDNFIIVNNLLEQVKVDASKESQFCLWLQGVMDSCESQELSVRQFEKVKQKLTTYLTTQTRTSRRTHYHNEHDEQLSGAIAKC